MEKLYFKSQIDKMDIPYFYFKSIRKNTNNNIIIFHGMCEPAIRYAEFSNFLSNNGYNVFVMEIRGHGELKDKQKNKNYGDFGKKGIKNVYSDVNTFLHLLEKNYDVNIKNTTIFGHSLGSLITTKIFIDTEYKNIVISGFPMKDKFTARMGLVVTSIEKFLRRKKSILKKISYIASYYLLDDSSSDYDLLSRSNSEVKKYMASEYCNYDVTPSFFNGIFKMMLYISKKYKKVHKSSKMLVIYGSDDLIVTKSIMMKMLNYWRKKEVSITIIENVKGRHESLNEINKYQIYDHILNWLNSVHKK